MNVPDKDNVVILTPIKNAERYLDRYFQLLRSLDYPKEKISVGMMEGDSDDATFSIATQLIDLASKDFRRARLWKHDIGFRLKPGIGRHVNEVQLPRRAALAKARNRLLFNALSPEEIWVLWVDVDLVDYSPTILTDLIAFNVDVVQPDCVRRQPTPSGREPSSYDLNAWRDKGRLHMHSLRREGPLVPLDSVGGTMLLVRADAHREGLVFPTFPYGVQNQRIRDPGQNYWHGEIETEGLGILAADMGIKCWGATQLRTVHH